jgi:hypothetical protein
MANESEIRDEWAHLLDQVKNKWRYLTDADLRFPDESIDRQINRLIVTVQQRTGEPRAAIEYFLAETASRFHLTSFGNIGGRTRSFAREPGEGASTPYNLISDRFGHRYEYFEDTMHAEADHSAASLAMAGLLVGALGGLVTTGLAGFGIAMVILALHSPAALPAVSEWPGVIFTMVTLGGLALAASLISSLVYSYYNRRMRIGAVPRWLENLEVMRRYVADEPTISRTGGRMQ